MAIDGVMAGMEAGCDDQYRDAPFNIVREIDITMMELCAQAHHGFKQKPCNGGGSPYGNPKGLG